jgi:hypothetical protein
LEKPRTSGVLEVGSYLDFKESESGVSAKDFVVYVLPGRVGGVVTNLSNLQEQCDRVRFSQHTTLTHNMLDRDTPFEGMMASDSQCRFDHSLPLEAMNVGLVPVVSDIPSGVREVGVSNARRVA